MFLTLLLAAMSLVVLHGNNWLILCLIGSAAVLGSLATWLWLSALRDAVVESQNLLLNEKVTIPVQFKNHRRLVSNHKDIARKFELSAAYIANLSNPEKLKAMGDIDTKDAIGAAIQSIRSELVRAKEEEDRRNWVTQGLAKFAEILRHKAELKQYASYVTGHLVRYVGVNQGGMYIESEDEEGGRCLDLLACYAYSKERFQESRIPLGSGLLGQCMVEQEIILITDIPRDYVKITSGLGEATPRNVLIVPLLFNDTFFGAVELVSFDHLQSHQIEFVKEVCQSIAAEVAALKSINQTQRLLAESNVLAEKLQVRESELQHHLEALGTAQQEMSRNQAELSGTIHAINGTLAAANFTLDGQYAGGNDIFLKVLGYDEYHLKGKDIGFFIGDDPSMKLMWENLRLGKFFSGEFKMRDHTGKEMWLSGTFNPITVEGQVPQKILMLAQFTTQEKEKLNELSSMVAAFKSAVPVIEFNADFTCKTANDKAQKLFNLNRMQLRSKRIEDFFAVPYHAEWTTCQQQVLNADAISLRIPMALQDRVATFEVGFSLARGLDGEVTRVVLMIIRELNDNVSMVA